MLPLPLPLPPLPPSLWAAWLLAEAAAQAQAFAEASAQVPAPDEAWLRAILGPYGAVVLLLVAVVIAYRGGVRRGADVDQMRRDYEQRLADQKTDYEQRLADARREAEWWRRTAIDALGAGERIARQAMEDSGHGR